MGINSNILSLITPAQVIENLRRRVVDERLAKGWSQKEMALRAGIKVPTYAYFERTGQISLERLAAICEALGHLDDLEKVLVPNQLPSIDDLKRTQRQRGRTISRVNA